MNDQEILDNAPEGTTHYSQGGHYLALNSSNNWMRYDPDGFANAKWFEANDFFITYCSKNFRSLADIKRIAQLEKELRDNRADSYADSYAAANHAANVAAANVAAANSAAYWVKRCEELKEQGK